MQNGRSTGVASAGPAAAVRLVLLAERDDDTRAMYAEYLRSALASAVEEVPDGREALAKAISRRPDVIVSGVRLFGISGVDLCALLRREVLTRHIPIILTTASPEEAEAARQAGPDAVLLQPCRPDVLAAEIQRVAAAVPSPQRAAHAATSRALPEVTGRAQARAHQRLDTTSPPLTPPEVICPECDQPLLYQRSHVGGVSIRHAEQWDYYRCPGGCGTFQYRQRTRRLKKVL